MYWSVFMLCNLLATTLMMLQFFRHYPPEAKVIGILWLVLPRFHGAQQCYTSFLEKRYAKHEKLIDAQVLKISKEMQQFVFEKIKAVLFVLFFSTNATSAMSNSSTKHKCDDEYKYSGIFSMLPSIIQGQIRHSSFFHSDDRHSGNESVVAQNKVMYNSSGGDPDLKKSSYSRLRNKLRDEFKMLLIEGIFLKTTCGSSGTKICELHLMPNSAAKSDSLIIRTSLFDTEDSSAAKFPAVLAIPMHSIKEIKQMGDSPIENTHLILSWYCEKKEVAHDIQLEMEELEDADMLIQGLRLLVKQYQ